jgi:hypothetical protein
MCTKWVTSLKIIACIKKINAYINYIISEYDVTRVDYIPFLICKVILWTRILTVSSVCNTPMSGMYILKSRKYQKKGTKNFIWNGFYDDKEHVLIDTRVVGSGDVLYSRAFARKFCIAIHVYWNILNCIAMNIGIYCNTWIFKKISLISIHKQKVWKCMEPRAYMHV